MVENQRGEGFQGDFRVLFHGVRGSLPVPGPGTARVGGNTSCVELQVAGRRIVLDGGTGLRRLGLELAGQPGNQGGTRLELLFSHLHWDHIQGLPFFSPLYRPDAELTLIGPPGLETALRTQMSPPGFPVELGRLPSRLELRELGPSDSFRLGPVRVTVGALLHPGGAQGYRVEHDGRSVVYACDHEHPSSGPDPALLRFAAGADLLIHDAQYLPEELLRCTGWGHSSYVQAAQLAREAGVGRLLLTHHDPVRSDAEVNELARRARRIFPATWAAREGTCWRVLSETTSCAEDLRVAAHG